MTWNQLWKKIRKLVRFARGKKTEAKLRILDPESKLGYREYYIKDFHIDGYGNGTNGPYSIYIMEGEETERSRAH